ncbi:MAG: YgiQ family radical SAM protein [Prevotellaceae bacterium]|nr:YgiQ family radical SAM protein [Prevotellaceae bacterium]
MNNTGNFLPTSKKEMEQRGWGWVDVILFTGDAYVDHPSFGAAVIGRILENEGYRVAIVPQPNWRDDLRDFKKLGAPRLFFGVTAGAMDSMINHYTANKRLRSNDAYTPEGKAGFRPDYAVTVYAQILKKLYPDVPVVLGGIEASLRRLTHYDYWQDKLNPSILIDSGADILVYGMGEKPIRELAQRLVNGETVETIRDIPQTAFSIPKSDAKRYLQPGSIYLHSFEESVKDKLKFALNFKVIETESNRMQSVILLEDAGVNTIVVNPPYPRLSEEEIDASFDLPYTRLPHPRYKDKRIPAYEMIRHSVNIHRGCFGGCSFCTISAHQGKFISSRSPTSVLKEFEAVTQMSDFKGYLSDVGGPSANMYRMQGKNEQICALCRRPSCIYPQLCRNLNTDHSVLTGLYQAIRKHPKVKKAFVGSGIRYDLFLDETGFRDKSGELYFDELMLHHISGRLKVAPEHTARHVLDSIRKPSFKLFEVLKTKFDEVNHKNGLNLQLIPYFISSLPGCSENDMEELVGITRRLNFKLEQVQDFTPTPMTLSSTMYYTGIDPYTLKKVFIPKTKEQKQRQQSYFFWYKKE